MMSSWLRPLPACVKNIMVSDLRFLLPKYMVNFKEMHLCYTRLTDLPGQELHPKWHPSGDQLIFARCNDGPPGIYLLDLSPG